MELIGLIFVVWILYQIFKEDDPPPPRNYSSGQTNYEYRGNYSDKKNEYAGKPSRVKFKTSPTQNLFTNDKVEIKCKSCEIRLRIPAGKSGIVKCPECGHRNRVKKTAPNNAQKNKLLEGINDPLTGEEIDINKTLYTCVSCGVFYHESSFTLIKEENSSQCVACQSTNIIVYSTATTESQQEYQNNARNHEANQVTLNNYTAFENQVITFEGHVPKVLTSRRGSDYAVMFENKSWRWGLKLVFFRGVVYSCGGPNYIQSLEGKTVTVRGLLIKHRKFGWEIVINDPSMILSVK